MSESDIEDYEENKVEIIENVREPPSGNTIITNNYFNY